MTSSPGPHHAAGKHRYTSVVDGIALANAFADSRQTMSEFARSRGVSFNMVRYWSIRARRLSSASEPSLVQVAEVSATGVIEAVTSPTLAPTPPPAPRPPSLPSMVVASPPASAPPTIEVRLPGGVSIAIGAGFSPVVLSQVIACLGGRPC